MNRILGVAVLAALILTAPVSAQTPPANLRPSIAVESPQMQLVILASALRFRFAGSTALALQPLSEDERTVLRSALGPPTGLGQWRVLIGGATQFVRVRGERAETVWWNPLADAGMVVSWTQGTDRWRITSAAPFVGEALRGTPAAVGPDFVAALRSTSLATRQAVNAGAAARIFETNAAPSFVFARADQMEESLIGSDLATNRLAAGSALLIDAALPTAGENGALGRLLATMPGEARLLLLPTQRVSNVEGETIFWASAGLPNTLIAMHYPATAPTAAIPAQIVIVNLIVADGEAP